MGVGVIAANLPALAPLFKQRKKLVSSFSSSIREKLLRSSRKESVVDLEAVAVHNKSMHDAYSAEGEAKGYRNESVGVWDQFERMEENQSAEELGTSRTMSRPML